MPILLMRHFWGEITERVLAVSSSFSKNHSKFQIGELRFYGPIKFINDCSNAINIELYNYDNDLKTFFETGKIKLTFFYDEKRYLCSPTAGVYLIPEPIWGNGPEAICQYIVYCYFYSKSTAWGLEAAFINYKDFENIQNMPKQNMQIWLSNVKFPEKWINFYTIRQPTTAK